VKKLKKDGSNNNIVDNNEDVSINLFNFTGGELNAQTERGSDFSLVILTNNFF
jgi:hypothetical protein